MKKSDFKKRVKEIFAAALTLASVMAVSVSVFAQEAEETAEAVAADGSGLGILAKAVGAGVAMGLAALGGALGMGMVSSKSAEGVARQPEAQSKIQGVMMLSLVFIETAIIYALVVAILIIFVL